jgi:pimeloyl-ACP methyl ester carboxylesterase
MEDHAADVLGLFDHLGIEEANFGGHSYGGLLTYHLAAHHPARVDRCVIIDAPFQVDEGILEQIRPSLDRLGKTVPSWEDYLTAVKAQPHYQGWWDSQIETYYRADVEIVEDGSVRSRSHPDHIRQAVEGTIGVPWASYLDQIESATLIFRATQPFGPPGSPPILDATQAQSMLKRLSRARLVELEANHLTMLFGESAATMAAEITGFLGAE